MAGDVIINTEVIIDEVLELEVMRVSGSMPVCSTILPNHIVLSVPHNKTSIDIDGYELIYTKVFCAQAVSLQASQWDGIPSN